jgi:hypothetical protein
VFSYITELNPPLSSEADWKQRKGALGTELPRIELMDETSRGLAAQREEAVAVRE